MQLRIYKSKCFAMINNFQFREKKGFTLIELLIVVAIISILSTLLMVNFIAVRQRGRDAQRKSDLREIQSALELYRADKDNYPAANTDNTIGISCNGKTQITGDSNCPSSNIYMQKVPQDPSGSSYYNQGKYYYSTDQTNYTLAACVENTNDTDPNICTTGSVAGVPSCPSGLTGCASAYYYVLTNP